MPNVFIEISNHEDAIARPINFAIASKALAELGFPKEAYLQFTGENQAAQTKGGQVGPDPLNKNYFGTDTLAIMTVSEEPVIQRNYENRILRRDEFPYFRDPVLQVYVRPAYAMYQSSINFELRFASEPLAMKWHKDILARSQMARTVIVHKAEYHIPVPEKVLIILYEIHHLREQVVPTGEDFSTWFKRCTDARMASLSNQAGKGLTLVLTETQANIQGSFDFVVTAPKPVMDKELGVWRVQFAYNYFYNCPIGNGMTYPMTVMNAILPRELINVEEDYDLAREDVALGVTEMLLEQHSPKYTIIDRRYVPIRIPAYDTWRPEMEDNFTKMEFQVAVTISPDDRRSLIDLTDMGEFSLTPETIEFLKKEYRFVTKRRRSLIDISLYVNDAQANDETIELDANLNLVATRDLDLSKVYHLRFAYLIDLSMLRGEDKDRTINNGCQAYQILAYLFPHLVEAGLIPLPGHRCFWTPEEWKDIVTVTHPPITGGDNPGYEPGNHNSMTQARFGIIAMRD